MIFDAQFIIANNCEKQILQFYHAHSKRTVLPMPACSAPSSYVAGWHTVVQLVLAPGLTSWPQRFAAALLLIFFAEIVSFILALILVSYDMIRTSPSVTVREEITTDFETDGVSEAPYIASPSSSVRVQSRIEFAELGQVKWPTCQVPGVVLGKASVRTHVFRRIPGGR